MLSKISIYQLIFKTEEAGVEGEGEGDPPPPRLLISEIVSNINISENIASKSEIQLRDSTS